MFSHPFILGFLYFVVPNLFLLSIYYQIILIINILQTISKILKKKIMMIVGVCIFLVAAAQALPLFFGLQSIVQALGIHHVSRRKRKSIRELSRVQGTPEATWIYGIPGTLHHLGCMCRWWSHPRLYHSILHSRFCCRSRGSCYFSLHWSGPYLLQTEKGFAHKEGAWCVHLCLFA